MVVEVGDEVVEDGGTAPSSNVSKVDSLQQIIG